MKKILSVFVACLFVNIAYSQTIKYQKTFDEAIAKVSTQKKLVFMVVDVPKHPISNFNDAIDKQEVVEKYNTNFINYKVLITDTAYARLRKKYPVTIVPAYFFLDKNSNVVYKSNRSSIDSKKYLNIADSALKAAASGNTLSDYDTRYQSGNTDASFLKAYIMLRQKMDINDNSKILDTYVDNLSVKALSDYQEILFILKAGPTINSRAYSLAYINYKIVDSIYKKEPVADRIAINKRIINNSYQAAVNQKSAVLAQQLANYVRGTYKNDYRMGNQESARYMVNYYQAVQDTANYLRQGSYYCDSYYMNISADSAKRLTEKQRAKTLAILQHQSTDNKATGKPLLSIDSAKHKITKETFGVVGATQDVAMILNNAAYNFYKTGTHNPNYLIKAINWSRRSIDLKPVSAYYDTLAHLLYRYGFYAEAEEDQNTAIEMAKQENQPLQIDIYKTELIKIKKRSL